MKNVILTFALLMSTHVITKANVNETIAKVNNDDEIATIEIQNSNINNENIVKDNIKLKTLKKHKKYRFEINKNSFGTAVLNLITFVFPIGQILNKDY